MGLNDALDAFVEHENVCFGQNNWNKLDQIDVIQFNQPLLSRAGVVCAIYPVMQP